MRAAGAVRTMKGNCRTKYNRARSGRGVRAATRDAHEGLQRDSKGRGKGLYEVRGNEKGLRGLAVSL